MNADLELLEYYAPWKGYWIAACGQCWKPDESRWLYDPVGVHLHAMLDRWRCPECGGEPHIATSVPDFIVETRREPRATKPPMRPFVLLQGGTA